MTDVANDPVVSDAPLSLDLEVIARLRELGGDEDPGLFDELVLTFADDSPARVAAIGAAVAAGDAQALHNAAHGLKSSAASMGAMLLSATCRTLEKLGRDGNVDGARELASSVPELYEGALNSLQREVGC